MSKQRGFSIVLHNLRPGSKDKIEPHFKDSKWNIIGEEMYPERPTGPDCHYHVFVEYHNPRSFKKVLKEMQQLSSILVFPEPQVEGSWGRVQVDKRQGTQEECWDYLKGFTKDKPTDANLKIIQANDIHCNYCEYTGSVIHFRFNHPNQTGVCYQCYHEHKKIPGDWMISPGGIVKYMYSHFPKFPGDELFQKIEIF